MIPNNLQVSLRDDNPYSVGAIIVFDEGDTFLEAKPFQVSKSNRDRYYTTVGDERIWNITFEGYNSSKWWWLIAKANDIDFPFELAPGKSLLVPDLNKFKIGRI